MENAKLFRFSYVVIFFCKRQGKRSLRTASAAAAASVAVAAAASARVAVAALAHL